jgi:hypothetical protein
VKKFARHKTFEEVVRACHQQEVYCDTAAHERGGDTICVGAPARTPGCGWVVYSTFNGRFFGSTPYGVHIDSDSQTHDGEPWMQALLKFFYADDASVAQPATAVDYTLGGVKLLELA